MRNVCITRRFLSNAASVSGVGPHVQATKPWEEIPTIPDRSWPILGHFPAMAKKHGMAKSWKSVMDYKKKYVPEHINMLRLNMPVMNPSGQGRLVMLFDPQDVETVYRNDGKYPNRGAGLAQFLMLRKRRPDVFGETTGLLMEEGHRWQEIRSKVQQDLMRPKSAFFYLGQLSEVAEEFCSYIKRERDASTLVNKGDFIKDLYMYGLESISVVAIDTKMGCLKENPDPVMRRKLDVGNRLIEVFPKLAFSLPTWKFHPPRWNPTFRAADDAFSEYVDFIKGKVDEAVERIRVKKSKGRQEEGDKDVSVLEKLIEKNPDSPIPFVMAFDMVVAGIDSTGNTASFLMYNLATNPEKQELLRKEVTQFGPRPTEQELGKMKYFRACLRESFRCHPTIQAISRVLPHDLVLKGYNIPKNTHIMWNCEVLHRDARYFPDAEKFVPERWLDNDKGKPEIPSFSVLQFSHGPRMCIGKRFAELEIQLLFCQLLSNFKIEWAGEDRPLETKFTLFNVPDATLKFKFIDL